MLSSSLQFPFNPYPFPFSSSFPFLHYFPYHSSINPFPPSLLHSFTALLSLSLSPFFSHPFLSCCFLLVPHPILLLSLLYSHPFHLSFHPAGSYLSLSLSPGSPSFSWHPSSLHPVTVPSLSTNILDPPHSLGEVALAASSRVPDIKTPRSFWWRDPFLAPP